MVTVSRLKNISHIDLGLNQNNLFGFTPDNSALPISGRDSAVVEAILPSAFTDISIGKYCSIYLIVYYWLDSLEGENGD